MPPLWLFVYRCIGQLAERSNSHAISTDRRGGELRTRRFIHEGHELVREARHRAADADAAHVGTATNAIHPPALRHVAIHNRPPASEFHNAFGRAVGGGEVAPLIIPSPVAALMD